jgi:hypothetical protein
VSWLQRAQRTDEVIESGRKAQAELHSAACKLGEFVAELEALVAVVTAERECRAGDEGEGRAGPV